MKNSYSTFYFNKQFRKKCVSKNIKLNLPNMLRVGPWRNFISTVLSNTSTSGLPGNYHVAQIDSVFV